MKTAAIKKILYFSVLYVSVTLLSCNYNNLEYYKKYAEIEHGDSIEIPFNFENGRIAFETSINGKPGKFYLDTGSPMSFGDFPTDNLRCLGDIGYVNFRYKGRSEIYALKEITLNGVTLNIHSLIVHSLIVSDNVDEGFDGILGLDIFQGYWCEISFSKNAIVLHKEKPDYFTQSLSAEYIRKDNNFYIHLPVKLDNQLTYLLIDTGMIDAMRFPTSIIRKKQKQDYIRLFSIDEIKESYLVKTGAFTLFDETFTDKFIITNSYYQEKKAGLLGINFLKYYDFLLDLTTITESASRPLYYQSLVPFDERNYVDEYANNRSYSFIPYIPASGILRIHGIYNCCGLIGGAIDDILEDGVAYKEFGLRPDMVITKVNGTPIREIPWETLASDSFPDTIIECTILENGKERTIMRKSAKEVAL